MAALSPLEKETYTRVFQSHSEPSRLNQNDRVVLASTITQKVRIDCDLSIIQLFMAKIKQVAKIKGDEELYEVQFYVLLRMCAINQRTLRQDLSPKEVYNTPVWVCDFVQSELGETQIDSLVPLSGTLDSKRELTKPDLTHSSSDELDRTHI